MTRYEIVKWNAFLATRERGRRVREEVEHELAGLSPGEALVISFRGVEGITVSFGDECIAKLIVARSGGDFDDRGLVIEEMNSDVRETLQAVLARRKTAAVVLDEEGEPEILGEPRWLTETLAAALALRSFRAADLATRLGISPQAANNRLKNLVTSGAVARERIVPEGGGKEFSYEVMVPAYT